MNNRITNEQANNALKEAKLFVLSFILNTHENHFAFDSLLAALTNAEVNFYRDWPWVIKQGNIIMAKSKHDVVRPD